MVDSIELVHKDIETIIMTVFFMFKKLEERLTKVSRDEENVKRPKSNF